MLLLVTASVRLKMVSKVKKQMKLCFGLRLTPTEDNSTANELIEPSSSKDEVTIKCKTKRNYAQQWLKTCVHWLSEEDIPFLKCKSSKFNT